MWSILNDTKRSNVLQVLDDYHIEVACISETWFDSKNGKFTADIKEAGYEIVHGYREDKRGGGIAILYKKTLNAKPGEASSMKYMSFEFSSLVLSTSRAKILLVSIYRKQEHSCNIFCDELEKYIEGIFHKGDTILLVGDFNVWVDVKGDRDAKKLLKLMNAFGLTQLINEPTHRDGHTLDHLYVNPFQMDLKYEVIDNMDIKTDHYAIVVSLPSIEHQQKKQTISYRNTKNMDIDNALTDFKQVFDEVHNSINADFEANYSKYDILSRRVMEKHAPLISRTITEQDDPTWMDTEYKLNRAKRRKLEKQWRQSKTEENRKAYVTQRHYCAEMSISKKKEYYSKIVTEAGNDQKSLFKVANELLDKNKVRSLPDHEDPVKLANEFNEYYIKKIENIRKTIPANPNSVVNPTQFEGNKLHSFEPTTVEELEEIINEYGIKTAKEDPIPANTLKIIIKEALPTLAILVNKSLSSGCMDGVKMSVIDPLLKKCGLDTDAKKNYRPVSNLVFFSKLIERVVLKRLNTHMTCNGLHSDTQFGYKKYHSTETMMLGLVNEVLKGFDDNKCTIILFLDLSAAFDTIDIERLLSILTEEIGITGTAIKWIRSFLTGRLQKVRIENEYSESLEVVFGAPQGSVLGPKMFSLYVRSQPEVFNKCKFKSSSFADDSNGRKTFSLSFQYDVLNNEVAKCLDEVTQWMNYQFLKINPDKTELLLLYPKSMESDVIIRGTIINDQQCIRYSEVVKNVGVWIDKHLDMKCHVNKVVSHCYKILKDIGRVRPVLSQTHTEMLVHSMISIRIDYCNSIFYNMGKSNLYKLQKVQNAAARLIVQKRRRESISNTLKQLHWLRIESRIIFKILLLVYKSIQGTCSNNLQLDFKSYNCRPEEFLMLKTGFCKTKYGKRTYDYVAPRLWNALPLHIRTEKLIKFKKMVKTLLFEDTEGFKCKAFLYN